MPLLHWQEYGSTYVPLWSSQRSSTGWSGGSPALNSFNRCSLVAVWSRLNSLVRNLVRTWSDSFCASRLNHCFSKTFADSHRSGGGSGIRTHVTVSRKHAFQACAFSHSATPPAAGSSCRRRQPFSRRKDHGPL